MNGHDFAVQRNPHRNRQFRRKWTEPASRCKGVYSTGALAAETMADRRFRQDVERVHDLGCRVVAELLAEIGAERGIQTVIDLKLATYAQIDPKVIEAIEAAGFWPTPLHEVRGGP